MKHVVFIDDEEELTELFPLMFAAREDLDIKCFTAHARASDYMRDHEVDVLLVDYRMREGTAIDFLAGLEGDYSDKTYIVTGELSLPAEEEARVAGVVKKPFRRESFESIL